MFETKDGKTPTGRVLVLRDSSPFWSQIRPDSLREQILRKRKVLVEPKMFDEVLRSVERANERVAHEALAEYAGLVKEDRT